MWIAVAFLAAHIIADMHCAPPKLNLEQIGMIRANILAQLGMTELPPPLTPDQVKLAEALRDYHSASKARRSLNEVSTFGTPIVSSHVQLQVPISEILWFLN